MLISLPNAIPYRIFPTTDILFSGNPELIPASFLALFHLWTFVHAGPSAWDTDQRSALVARAY